MEETGRHCPQTPGDQRERNGEIFWDDPHDALLVSHQTTGTGSRGRCTAEWVKWRTQGIILRKTRGIQVMFKATAKKQEQKLGPKTRKGALRTARIANGKS